VNRAVKTACLTALALGVCAGTLGALQSRFAPKAFEAHPLVTLMGGFRGIVAEIIWFRADRLQDTGRFAELAQLATWLTALEPQNGDVWAYQAWNLAYNVSVMMPDAADRWRWVEAGLKLLRDEALKVDGDDPVIHRELAWLFLSKLAGRLDDAAPYYRAEWKKRCAATDREGIAALYGTTAARLDEVDRAYRPLDWSNPFAGAVLWADTGLLHVGPDAGNAAFLRQILYQALMGFSLSDSAFAPLALREMENAARLRGDTFLDDIMNRWRAKYAL